VGITPEGKAIIDDNLDRAKEIADAFVMALGKRKYDQLVDLLEDIEAADLSKYLNR